MFAEYATKSFSQFRAGSVGQEHKGRTATLKAVAYCTAEPTTDERNNRHFHFNKQQDQERVLYSSLFIPLDAPEDLRRDAFPTLAAQQQAVWTSLAKFEEKQRYQHAGRGGHSDQPIISRQDLVLLDQRLYLDDKGQPRPDGLKNLQQVMNEFIRDNFTKKGLVASYSIHDQKNGNGNFHGHIVSSYRTLTPDGWDKRKRPFGEQSWAFWVKQHQVNLKRIQTSKLEGMGIIAPAPRTEKRHTMTAYKLAQKLFSSLTPYRKAKHAAAAPRHANQSRRPQPATGGSYHGKTRQQHSGTKDSYKAYISVCKKPLSNMHLWMETEGRSKSRGLNLFTEPRDGVAGNDRVQPLRTERVGKYDPLAVHGNGHLRPLRLPEIGSQNPLSRPLGHYAGMLGEIPNAPTSSGKGDKEGDGKTGKGGSGGGMASAMSALRFGVLNQLHRALGGTPVASGSSGGGSGERRRASKWVPVERRQPRAKHKPSPPPSPNSS